jgi:glycosyltransferase involved in cell wall biosynthesis
VVVPTACRALARAGVRPAVYTTLANGQDELDYEPRSWIDQGGVKVRYFPRVWPRSYFHSPQLAAELSGWAADFDILHLHGVFCHTNWAAFAAARAQVKPYVVTVHGCLDPQVLRKGLARRLKKAAYIALIERHVMDRASRLIALTDTERCHIEALRFRTPVVVLPNGLDPQALSSHLPREAVEARFPRVKGHPYVLFLSRLHPKKGLDLLVPAFASLIREHPEWRLLVAGPEEGHGEAMRQQVRQLGLEAVVEFTGPVYGEDKLALLGHAGIFCLPSRSEGLPTVVVEALFCGRPVLITETCYMPEVAAEEAGVVVPPTAEALGEGLHRLAGEPAWRAKLGQRGQELAQRRYDAARVAEATRRMYEEVIEEHRRGTHSA